MASPTIDLSTAGACITPTIILTLADLIMRQLVNRVMVGAIEVAGKRKAVRKGETSTLALLAKPLYKILEDTPDR